MDLTVSDDSDGTAAPPTDLRLLDDFGPLRGRLFVHESNPRNPLFLFYMCYLFPILKSIDEGTEWWIDPRTMVERDGFLVQDVRYFTFLPDFTPRFLMGPALAIERMLERGPTKGFSAHYMAVLRRTTGDTREAT